MPEFVSFEINLRVQDVMQRIDGFDEYIFNAVNTSADNFNAPNHLGFLIIGSNRITPFKHGIINVKIVTMFKSETKVDQIQIWDNSLWFPGKSQA